MENKGEIHSPEENLKKTSWTAEASAKPWKDTGRVNLWMQRVGESAGRSL